MYINDGELLKEIIISKGKGQLTKKAEILLIQLCENVFQKFTHSILFCNRYDVYMNGIEVVFKQWNKFDSNRYSKSLPFFTEIIKRGFADGYNKMVKWKSKGEVIDMIRIEF